MTILQQKVAHQSKSELGFIQGRRLVGSIGSPQRLEFTRHWEHRCEYRFAPAGTDEDDGVSRCLVTAAVRHRSGDSVQASRSWPPQEVRGIERGECQFRRVPRKPNHDVAR